MAASPGDRQLPPHSENVDEELVRIHHCLGAVFSASNPASPAATEWWSQRALADRYLTSFQRTTVSWLVCDRLLQEGDTQSIPDSMVQQQRRFFAAQTLHSKCRVDMQELPQESWVSLRDSLLAHLLRYRTTGGTALTTRLALAVSALAVQMGWCTIIQDLLANPAHQDLVMLVLRVLPEECASDRLLMLEEDNRFPDA